ncbi:succinylglutamate desuccinylase [Marinobacter orientalis]|uniref:Succinylglutamate desuccinylase n=1 Tax=Marinobacter orientalis TaxID=1928859 RepID=A0A7Y0NIR7_9GAMM|nr:succinylglutamate desuccinylase [Marinobacter orientalis]NMT62216.1 succinylglutamate desuccinylase [Marinobacter orientalis]TGX50932.1 succinylglutamate desuccinylase [Marinobacter orientalis]
MNVRELLFGRGRDWLSHTLSTAEHASSEKVVVLSDGTGLQLQDSGLLYLEPPAGRPNPDNESLIVSAGIHGNETAPIEVLNSLLNELLAGNWQLACPMLLILGNPPAMDAGERFIEVNLNRLFGEAHRKPEYRGLAEAERAWELERACQAFASKHPANLCHYDLHTAIRPSLREKFALYPFVAGRDVPRAQIDFLVEAEVDTLLMQHREGTTFASFSSTLLGAESFTVELGKARPFGHNDLSQFTGISNALRRRMKGDEPPEPDRTSNRITVFEVVHEILNTGPGFRFHVPDDVANFTIYDPGTVIWEDDATCYRVGDEPEAIVFPNRNVPVGQRVGLMVRHRHRGHT